MDQDFHYYGTYYAARVTDKFSRQEATVIAKASNFVDFLSNEAYGGYWHIVRDTEKKSEYKYQVVGKIDYPRYSFQGGMSVGIEGGSGGLWASYHFLPGNYGNLEGTSAPEDLHGATVAALLPPYRVRDVQPDVDKSLSMLLTRPQSPLSKYLFQDAVQCLTDEKRLEQIVECAVGGREILASPDKEDILNRFALLFLGARAHTIADTWAHQDWSPVNNEVNTYWDVNSDWLGRQSIDYMDVGGQWKNDVLSSLKHENMQAVPNGTTYFGHGWMGHFPDYSFIKYRYKPCWRSQNDAPHERDNPVQFKHAFLELCSLFTRVKGGKFDPLARESLLKAAQRSIGSHCQVAKECNCPRYFSSQQWMMEMDKLNIEPPGDIIDARLEPDPNAVLRGQVDHQSALGTRYGTYYVNYTSDLYLFAVALDYQFHQVKKFLLNHNIGTALFTDSWAKQNGPLQKQP
jgi:hypothetical protein